jgi:hypothetical protein
MHDQAPVSGLSRLPRPLASYRRSGNPKNIYNAGSAGKCRPKNYIDLTSLPDTNGNGVAEIAVLRRLANGFSQVVIKDITGELVRAISFFGANWIPKAVTSLEAGNGGIPVLSVMAVNEETAQVAVQNRDAVTGEVISRLWICPIA